jgi:hypothetical protein
MVDERTSRNRLLPTKEQVVGGVLAGHDKAMEDLGKHMLRDVGPIERFVGSRVVTGAPGVVLDLALLASAKDKRRAGAELAGQLAGGALGGAVAGPVGAAVGSVAGEKGAELLYDHKGDIADWMKARNAHIARRVADELRPYAPFDFYRRPGRPIGR